MLLSEIVEEIAEKTEHFFSLQSIIRKVNEVKGRVMRNYGVAFDVSRLDLEADLADYPSPVPTGSIVDILVDGVRYPLQRLKEDNYSQYYYLLDRSIGIYPTPTETIEEGLTIFHKIVSEQLTIGDMNAEPDFDNDYHMLLVYGALADMLKGAEAVEYRARYNDMLPDYILANQDPEPSTIKGVSW